MMSTAMERVCLVCVCFLSWSGLTSADGSGATPKLVITKHDQTEDGVLLECGVQGASVKPKPRVEWQDSTGRVLPAEETQVTERGGSYAATLRTTVTESGFFRCVLTRENAGCRTYAETFVIIRGYHLEKFIKQHREDTVRLGIGFGCAAVVLVVAFAVVLLARVFIKRRNQGPTPQTKEHLPLDNKETHDC